MALPTNDVTPIKAPPPPPEVAAAPAGVAPAPPLGAAAPVEPSAPPAPPAVAAAPVEPSAPPAPPAAAAAPEMAASGAMPPAASSPGQPSTNVATRPREEMSLEERAAADGIQGLEFDGFGLFPMVVLNQGEFSAKDLGPLGPEFYCQLQRGIREKFLLNNGLDMKDPNYDFVYTYDKVTAHNDRPVVDIIAEWHSRGWKEVYKKYMEAPAVLKYQHDGTPIFLSISPHSIRRFTKYWTRMEFAGKSVFAGITRVYKGELVTGPTIKFPFHPWEFDEYTG